MGKKTLEPGQRVKGKDPITGRTTQQQFFKNAIDRKLREYTFISVYYQPLVDLAFLSEDLWYFENKDETKPKDIGGVSELEKHEFYSKARELFSDKGYTLSNTQASYLFSAITGNTNPMEIFISLEQIREMEEKENVGQ